MFDKIKNYPYHKLIQELRDVRLLGFIVFVVLVLLATWSGINVIDTNFELQKQIAQLDQQNQIQDLQNTNLKLENEYYNSSTYLELTARKSLGKGAPGETLILVPKDVALAHAKQLPAVASTETKPASSSAGHEPLYKQHINAWLDFFLHRDSS